MERRTYQQIVDSELSVVRAQNERLIEENSFLREKLNRLTTNQRSTAASNVEAKIKAHQLEEERDQIWEHLEKLKKKYNKLHEAYCEKVKRCKILENTFQQQKTLPGLVMKSALKQRNDGVEKKESFVNLEPEVTKLQSALEEAYDKIDELEFELESVELLETENQRLRNDLAELKKNFKKNNNARCFGDNEQLSYEKFDVAAANRCTHRFTESVCESCLNANDFDNETLERSVLTHSLLEDAEAESHCLRRQLLKSRLHNKNRTNVEAEEGT